MAKLNPWVFGLVVAVTTVISYVLCTLFWLAFTEPSMDFLNTLTVLGVFAVWGYLIGAVYAGVCNVLLRRGTT